MTRQDLASLWGAALEDDVALLALADAMAEEGDEKGGEIVRLVLTVQGPLEEGRQSLRASLVDPLCLRVRANGEWHWAQFIALPGHPNPGNAGSGYSHPTDLNACMKARRTWHWEEMESIVETAWLTPGPLYLLCKRLRMEKLEIAHALGNKTVLYVDLTKKRKRAKS